MVERQLPKLNVAGSIPVSRSMSNPSEPARYRSATLINRLNRSSSVTVPPLGVGQTQ